MILARTVPGGDAAVMGDADSSHGVGVGGVLGYRGSGYSLFRLYEEANRLYEEANRL